MSKNNIVLNKKIKDPFFSIITVVKNDDKNIKKTITSVSKQTYKNFEYIIIDGNSRDKTLNVIIKNKKKINYLLSEDDLGIYDAMNKGLSKSNGKFIVYLNSGDTFTKNALSFIYKKYSEDKRVDFIFGTVKRHYTKKTILKYGYNPSRINYNFDFATSHSSGFFIKKKSFNKIGKFNIKYKCSADYDLYYKAIKKFKMIGSSTSKKKLVGIVKSGGFSSKISFLDHLFEETKIRLDNNQNIFFVVLIFLNALIKKFIKF